MECVRCTLTVAEPVDFLMRHGRSRFRCEIVQRTEEFWRVRLEMPTPSLRDIDVVPYMDLPIADRVTVMGRLPGGEEWFTAYLQVQAA